MAEEKGLIYVMDMESSLADALTRRIIDFEQYVVYRPWHMALNPEAEVQAYGHLLKGIILSGSAKNINANKYIHPSIPTQFLEMGVPILAVCYGMQYLCHLRGVKIVRCWEEMDKGKRTKAVRKKDKGEQGPTNLSLTPAGQQSPLFQGLGEQFPVWMKHHWMAEEIPEGWTLTASTARCPVAAMERGNNYAVQFHPEPYSSLFGKVILYNFLTRVCQVPTPYF